MPPQRFIRAGSQPPSSGGSGPGTTPTISWGSDFGESGDDNTFTVGNRLTMPSLAAEYTKSVGVQLTMPELSAVYNSKSVGVHLSGTASGPPFWQSESHDGGTTSGTTELSCDKPSGTVAGDLLIAFIGVQFGAGTSGSINNESGWTTVRNDSITVIGGAAFEIHSKVFYRIADGTEPSLLIFDTTTAPTVYTAEIHRINGAHATTPLDANAGSTLLATALDPDPSAPAVTTVADNCLIFAHLFHPHSALSQTHTPPASHVERTDFQGSITGLNIGSTSATRVFATAGSQAAVEFNCTETTATDAIMQRISIAPGTITLSA